MDLDARPYRCFIAVAETGSFRRAAARLNLSQPALSAQIKELERRLGFALFQRSSRSVSITGQGHLFLPNAKRLVAETELANRAAFDIRTNQLRIGAPFYTALIPERMALVDRFMRAHPAVPLRIMNEDHVRNLAALRAEECDLVFAIMPGPARAGWQQDGLPASMEWLSLIERPMRLILPATHPLAAFDPIPAASLAGVAVARPGRLHGRGLSDAIATRLDALGAQGVRPPEAHAIALEHYAGFAGVAAIALGWVPEGRPAAPAALPLCVRDVAGLGLASCLALIRNRSGQRAAAEDFVALAEAAFR